MKKVRRVVVWLLIVCIFLQFPLVIRAEEPDMDYESLFERADRYGLEPQDAINAFFSNPGHFMRALAYHNGSVRYDIRFAVNNDMTDSQAEAAYYLLALLATAPYGDNLSQSEKDTIDFFFMGREGRRLSSIHSAAFQWPEFKDAILEQMQSDRAAAADRLAAAIYMQYLDVVGNLVEESEQVQAHSFPCWRT